MCGLSVVLPGVLSVVVIRDRTHLGGHHVCVHGEYVCCHVMMLVSFLSSQVVAEIPNI